MANEVNNAAVLSTAASASSASASLNGIHEIQISLEELTRDFYEKAGKFYDYIEEAFNSMIGKTDAEREGKKDSPAGGILPGAKKKEKESPSVKVTKSLKVDKLIDFQDSVAGLGVIVHSDFQELFKKMDKNGDKGKKAKGKGIGDLFDGLEKGAKSLIILAGALVAFAVASVVFQFVDWPSAIAGLVLFTGFVMGTVYLAKTLKKESKNLQEFSKGVLWMTLGYAAFGVAMFIVGNILKYCDMGGVVASLLLFAGFVAGTVVVARMIKEYKGDFVNFAEGVLIMVGAYLAFGVAIVLVSQLAKFVDWPGLIASLALFAGFIAGTVAVAKMLKNGQGDLVQFALGSMLMSVAFLTFGLAIWVIANLNDQLGVSGWMSVVGTMAIMAAVIAGAVIAGNFVQPQSLIMLALGSVLLAIGFVSFGFAIKYLAAIPIPDLLKGILVIVSVMAFYVAVGLLGSVAMPYIAMSIPMFGIMAISSLLIMLAMIPFGKAVQLINSMDITGQTLLNVLGIAGIMVGFLTISAASLLALPGIILFTAFSAIASPALNMFLGVLERLNKLDLSEAGVTRINDQLSRVSDIIDSMRDNLSVSLMTIAKITSFLLVIKPAKKAIDAVGQMLVKIAVLNKLKIDKNKFNQLLGIVQDCIAIMADQAKNFKGAAGKAALDMAAALKDVTAAINNIADVVLKLCELDDSKVEIANGHIKKIMKDLFVPTSDLENPHIMDLFSYLPSISAGALRAAEALVPITTAIDNLAGTIVKIGDVSPEIIANGIASLQSEVKLMTELSTVLKGIAGDAESGHLWWKSDTFEKANTALGKIGTCIDTIQSVVPNDVSKINGFANVMASLSALGSSNFDSSGFEKKIQGLGKGLEEIKNQNIIGKIQEIGNGLATVDVSTLDKINVVMDTFSNLTPQVLNISAMANALHTLNAELKELGSLDEASKNTGRWEEKASKRANKQTAVPAGASSVTLNTPDYTEVLKGIYNILDNWSKNGVNILMNEEEDSPRPGKDQNGDL